MLLRVSITLISAVAALSTWAGSWIRINQVGYLPQSTSTPLQGRSSTRARPCAPWERWVK